MIKKTIEEWMTKKVITTSKEETVQEAVKRMNNKHVGTLVVVENEEPIGIVTERDILMKVVAENFSASEKKVSDVMTTDIKTAEADASISKISCEMTQNNIKRMPVTKDGKLAGIVTSSDLLRIMAKQWACDL